MDNKINKIFKYIEKKLGNSKDIVKRIIDIDLNQIGYIYLESVSSAEKVSDFIVKSLSVDAKYMDSNVFDNIFAKLNNTIPSSKLEIIDSYDDMLYYLSCGYTIIAVDGFRKVIGLETKAKLDRGINSPESEQTIRGPKDSFTENYATNVGLIRKRIKNNSLWFDEQIVGKRTYTKVATFYIKDIANSDFVKRIIQKIEEIDTDSILDIGYIRDYLTKDNKSSFPTVISTERPDVVCNALLEGKIAIMVENSPYVIILPALFFDFMKVPEDFYQKPINTSYTRILRILAFIITIITPGLYIALTTFNREIIPSDLLIYLASQREGVPFPTAFEIIILITTFEILRESDIRMPSQMGTSISIVGALVLGDAAVSAGIVSPIVVIIVATTSVTSLVFTDIDIINACRFQRLFFIILSSFMGLIGFVIAFIIFIIKLSSIKSLGIPYLIPLSPFYKNSLKDAFLTIPKNKQNKRPPYLDDYDNTKGESNEN